RRGRDREVALLQVVARAREGQGLERLRRGAHERDEAGLPGRRHDAPVLHRDRMDDVHRLDDRAPPNDYPERLHRKDPMPELPEMEAWRRALDEPVSAFPIAKAGPAHVATLKTYDPPLAALEGRRLAGAR